MLQLTSAIPADSSYPVAREKRLVTRAAADFQDTLKVLRNRIRHKGHLYLRHVRQRDLKRLYRSISAVGENPDDRSLSVTLVLTHHDAKITRAQAHERAIRIRGHSQSKPPDKSLVKPTSGSPQVPDGLVGMNPFTVRAVSRHGAEDVCHRHRILSPRRPRG